MRVFVVVLLLWLVLPVGADSIFSESDIAVAKQLREQGLDTDMAYEITADLTTRIGHRLAAQSPVDFGSGAELLAAESSNRSQNAE